MAGDLYVAFGADVGDLEAALAVANASVKANAAELRTLATEMRNTGAAADSELGQKMREVGANLAASKEAASGFASQLKSTGEAGIVAAEVFDRTGDSLKRLAEIAGIAFTVDAFKEWVSSTTEAAEKVERFAAKLGASTTDVQSIQSISKLTGGDFDQMATQLERLQLALAKTGEKASPAAAALKALGIDAQEFKSLQIPQQVEAMAEAFSRFADGPTKTAAAVALLGRAGADMIPYLDRGKEGLQELGEVSQRTGAIMSSDMVAAFASTREHINEMSLAWQGLSERIFAVVRPAIDAAIQGLTSLMEKADAGAIQSFAAAASNAIGNFAIVAVKAFEQIKLDVIDAIEFLDRMKTVVEALISPFTGLAAAIEKAANALKDLRGGGEWLTEGNLSRLTAPGGQYGPDQAGSFVGSVLGGGKPAPGSTSFGTMPTANSFSIDFGQELKNNALAAGLATKEAAKHVQDFTNAMNALLHGGSGDPRHEGGGGSGYTGSGLPQVPQMSLGGGGRGGKGSAGKGAEQDFTDEVDAAKRAAAQIEDTLNNELKAHQITMTQWAAQSIAALDKEADAIQDAVAKAIASANLTAAQKKAIANKEENELAAIFRKEADDQAKADQKMMQDFEAVANTIVGAWNSQLSGLIQGTTTWSQAFNSILADMLVKFIEMCEQMIIKWLATTVTMKAIEAAFNLILPGSGSAMSAVASFDVGSWSVPRDMLATVHQGEMIVPAAGGVAAQFRETLGGGGATQAAGAGSSRDRAINVASHVHINATDSSTVASMLMGNGGSMLKAINQAVRDGAHHGLRGLRR